MFYLRCLCLSLPPDVCRRVHSLFTLFVFVFTSRCLQEGSCLIYVICVCLYLPMFVGGFIPYLRYLCLSLPPGVCRRAHVLFTLFVFVFTSRCLQRAHVLFMLFVFVFTSGCLQEGSFLIYVICVCLYLPVFVGGLMSYLRYLCLSLPPVVCKEGSCLK